MPFSVSTRDIKYSYRDAIVIPARMNLKQCPGLSAEIFKKAGALRLSMACRKGKGLQLGEAFVTERFKMRYKSWSRRIE